MTTEQTKPNEQKILLRGLDVGAIFTGEQVVKLFESINGGKD